MCFGQCCYASCARCRHRNQCCDDWYWRCYSCCYPAELLDEGDLDRIMAR